MADRANVFLACLFVALNMALSVARAETSWPWVAVGVLFFAYWILVGIDVLKNGVK